MNHHAPLRFIMTWLEGNVEKPSFRICRMKIVVWRYLRFINKLVIISCPFILRYISCIRNSAA